MGSTTSTTVTIIEPIPASSGLSGELNCVYYYYNHQCSYTNSDEIAFYIIQLVKSQE